MHAVDSCSGYHSWDLSEVDAATRAVIRHAVDADVPTQAVHAVTFIKYDGQMEMESAMVAHRLGQLPIQGQEPMTFEIVGKGVGPLTWVTTENIVGDDARRVLRGTEDGVSDYFRLIPLLEGRQVHLKCVTALGTGRRHAKWKCCHVKRATATDPVISITTTGSTTPGGALNAALRAIETLFTELAGTITTP